MDQENPDHATEASAEASLEMTPTSEKARRAALPAAAQRALAEADARRAKQHADTLPLELGGRDGPEPVRFGDWEKKGIAIDF